MLQKLMVWYSRLLGRRERHPTRIHQFSTNHTLSLAQIYRSSFIWILHFGSFCSYNCSNYWSGLHSTATLSFNLILIFIVIFFDTSLLLVPGGIQCHLSPLHSHEHSIQTKWNNLTPLKFDRKRHSSSSPSHYYLYPVWVPQTIICKRKTPQTGATPCPANWDTYFIFSVLSQSCASCTV